MFDINNIGKKIADFRKINNITQMELADLMGVSYQAVSNWERGNSMPDIAKLPDLAKILNVSIDELLSEEASRSLIKNVIDGKVDEYIVEDNVSIKDVVDIAPILKPAQTETIIDKVIDNNKGKVTIKEIAEIAGSIDESFLFKLLSQVNEKYTIKDLCELAPYLDQDDLGKLAIKAVKTGDIYLVTELAPYLDSDVLFKLVLEAINHNDFDGVEEIAPYLDEDDLAELVMDAAKADKLDLVIRLAPYLDSDDLEDIAEVIVDKHGINGIKGLIPFM